MYQIEYEPVAATNYKDTFELQHRTTNRLGWESTEHAQPPIEVLVRLVRRAYVLKLQLRSRSNRQIPLLEVLTADIDSQQWTSAAFTSISKIFNVTNTECSVNVSRCCKFIKLVVLEKQQGVEVSIDALRVMGDQSLASPRKQHSNLSQERTDKLLIELGTRLDTPELFDDLRVLPVDEDTRITLRDMLKFERECLQDSNYMKAQQANRDLIAVLQLGKDILSAQQKKEWALAKDDFREAKSWDQEIVLLKRKRDRYDEIYETTRFEEMIELGGESAHHDQKFSDLLEADRKELEAFRLREESDVQQKRAVIDKEYEKAKEQNEPWWEKEIPTNRTIEAEEEKDPIAEEPPQPRPKEKTPQQSPRSVKKSGEQKSRQLKRGNKSPPPEESKSEEYDFNNPFVFNQGDADLERFTNPVLTSSKLNPDLEVLRHYEQLDFLNVLGTRAWLAISSDNWRQREAAAQTVLSFIENGIPEKYRNGKSKQLFLALMEFARLCCNDKILQIYYDGLKILATSLAPPICGSDVSPAMINKAIKDFVPILIEKISEMNSRAKEISLETLISIFNHPAADIQILTKELLRLFRQDQLGKTVSADKHPARIVNARVEIFIRMLQKIDLSKHKFNLKEVFELLAMPSLFHTNYDVRMGAIELIGELFRHLGQPMIVMINEVTGLKPNLQEMILSKVDEVREQLKTGRAPTEKK